MIAIPGVLALINIAGLPYYVLSAGERLRSPLHPLLRPSGLVGQSAGVLALLIFAFLWLYPLRKKYRWLAFTGPVARWLDVHILAAIGMPLLLGIHASWRFDGVIGLGYFAMMVVWASGIVGRYLYVRIPRGRTGVASTRDEVAAERRTLLTDIAAATGLDPFEVEQALAVDARGGGNSLWRTLVHLVADDVVRWRLRRRFRARLAQARTAAPHGAELEQVLALAAREVSLSQQLRMLDATNRVFRLWHVAHRPFALTALVAVVIHVAVVVSLGVTWFW